MKYYLYNKLSNNGIKPDFKEDMTVIDCVGLDYQKFFDDLCEDDEVVLVGGDGTVNYFINALDTSKIKNKVYYLARGTGNDFLNDLGRDKDEEIPLNDLIQDLPTVYVNGLEKKFINGIGYGIDGYCCEAADKIKEKKPNAKINYTSIAIKGLLFYYKPTHAKITVDGEVFEYDNVWLAPSMKGKFYGGGMMIAPMQDRKNKTLSVVIYKCKSKIKTLMVFPSIFKGEHVKKEDMVKIHTGTDILVEYTKPCALQIDGDTVLNVSSYRVKA
ncbi:diacylglycerol kinase family protein [bacterium]|nr:diacylglycerol kinase family protein [bacterium]